MKERCESLDKISPPSKAHLHAPLQLENFLALLTSDNGIGEPLNQQSFEKRRDKILLAAEFIFGSSHLSASLALLDNYESSITRVSSPHRSLWLVRGSSDQAYMCFAREDTPNLYYCSCRSYLEKTTKKASEDQRLPELCKHLLALKLIPALQINCPHLTLPDKDFAKLVMDRTLR